MMATDSVKFVDDDYVNRIHSTKAIGKLHKGHNVAAASASIPSKYQTVVIDNSERKGFNSRSKRFHYDGDANDHPGPGSYVGHGRSEKISSSYSKKGTGGFASKDRRIVKHQSTCSPGPGAYGLPNMLVTKQDYNKAICTSVFHQPIAVNTTDWKSSNPAPNQYDIYASKLGKTNNVTADAAFKSRSKRELMNIAEQRDKPSPWQYHVNDSLVRDSVQAPVSSFKSKTVRKMQHDPPPYPGPGTYKPHEPIDPVFKTVFPRKHYLCISAPAMPLPNTPPSPGPGSYEVVDYEGPPKHYMSGAAFVSTTSRWSGKLLAPVDFPGPAHYRPAEVGKQSFIYNAVGKWI